MGINDDSRLAEITPQDHVGSFPPDSWQHDQLFHRVGDLTAEPFGQHAATGHDVPGLALEEPGRPNEGFEFGEIGLRVVCRPAVSLEQRRRHLVDSLIRALGRQDGCDEKLQRGAIGQLHLGRRHRSCQRAEQACCASIRCLAPRAAIRLPASPAPHHIVSRGLRACQSRSRLIAGLGHRLQQGRPGGEHTSLPESAPARRSSAPG